MPGHISYGFVVSADGYIAGPEGGGEVGLPMPGDELHRYFNALQERAALSIYGRNMYEVMQYWDAPPAESSEVEQEYARAWQATPKVVVSTTLTSVGPNARLVTDASVVRQLKAEIDGEIEVGGAQLAASLTRLGLIDEYRMYIAPVVLGGGKPFFEVGRAFELEALGSESLPQSCTLLRFRPKQ